MIREAAARFRGDVDAPELSAGALHVWRAELERPTGFSEASLSRSERDRAARFRFEADRVRWASARAILRALLGAYLDRDPRAIDLELGPGGKPEVVAGDDLEFNVSHSGDLALFAFTLGNPVGVDVELAGRARDHLAIAARVLGADEHARLAALPPELREREFLRSWVRHEAALKCRGDGLGSPARQEALTLVDLELGPYAAAAVALERRPEHEKSIVLTLGAQ